MKDESDDIQIERPDSFWSRVYIAVVITTVVVIATLYGFMKYFSN